MPHIPDTDSCALPTPQPGQREHSFRPEQSAGKVFRGHRNQVTCLSVSTDGSVLLSGSHDESVRLWDVKSKQSLRTVTLKGSRCASPGAHWPTRQPAADLVFCVLQAQ